MRQLPVWALSSRVPILTALAQPTHDVVPIQVEHGEPFALGAFPVSVPPGMRVSLPSDGHLPSHGHACAWQVATDEERRRLARYFVEKVELDADRRKVEIQLKLPEAPAKHMEAAARVGALASIVVLAREFNVVNGRGRRPQRLLESGADAAR